MYALDEIIITDFEDKNFDGPSWLFKNNTKLPSSFNYEFPQEGIDVEEGLFRTYEKKDRKGNITTERILLTEALVFVNSKVFSIENDNYNYEIIAIHRGKNNKYSTITSMCPSSTLGQRVSLIKFLNNQLGINANDLNYIHFIEYFNQFIYENRSKLQTKRAIQKLGWNNGKFAQYDPEVTFDYSDDADNQFRKLVNAVRPTGDFKEWGNLINQFRHNNDFNFILGTSFAAPLLLKTNTRSYQIIGVGDSEKGKTFAAYCGLSIWGDPRELLIGAKASDNYVPKKAYYCQNIFMSIDDVFKKGSQSKRGFQDFYIIPNETGKARLNKDSKLMRQDKWRLTCFTSSEVPIIGDNANAGEYNRALEYEISKIYDMPKEELPELYGKLDLNYGHAGKMFIEEIQKMKEIEINELLKTIREKLSGEFSETKIHNHIVCVAASCLGLYLGNKIIFNDDNFEKAIDCGRYVLKKLMNKSEGRQEIKSLEEMYNFFEVNQIKFSKDAKNDVFGAVRDNEIVFITGPLKKHIEGLGYSYKLLEKYLIQNKLGIVKQAKIKGKNGKRLVVKLPEDDIKTNYKLYYPDFKGNKMCMYSIDIDLSDEESLDQLDNNTQYFELNSEMELIEFNISRLPLSSKQYNKTERAAIIENDNDLPLPNEF